MGFNSGLKGLNPFNKSNPFTVPYNVSVQTRIDKFPYPSYPTRPIYIQVSEVTYLNSNF